MAARSTKSPAAESAPGLCRRRRIATSRPKFSDGGTRLVLRRHEGVIDLNIHPLPDLLDVGLSASEAKAVIQWRPFSSWDALLQALEIDEQRVSELRASGAGLTDAGTSLWPLPKPFLLSQH